MFFPPLLALTLINVFIFWWVSKSTETHKAVTDFLNKQRVTSWMHLRKGRQMDQIVTSLTWDNIYGLTTLDIKPYLRWISKCCSSCWVNIIEQITGHWFLLNKTRALIMNATHQRVCQTSFRPLSKKVLLQPLWWRLGGQNVQSDFFQIYTFGTLVCYYQGVYLL